MRAATTGWFLRSHAHPDLRLVNGFTDACFSFIFPVASHGQCLAGNLACELADSLASNVCGGCWIQDCQCQTLCNAAQLRLRGHVVLFSSANSIWRNPEIARIDWTPISNFLDVALQRTIGCWRLDIS